MNSQEWLMHFIQLCNGIKIIKIHKFLTFALFHENTISSSVNKNGNYYYNECLARIKAIKEAKKSNVKNNKIFKKMARQFCWHYLFIFYKGSPLRGIQIFDKYIYCIYVYLFN
jgi:GT2 family glycosyltransferase